MTHIDTQRRKLLLASGTALSVALAGCSGGGDDDGDGDGDDDGDSDNGGVDVPSEADDYLGDANNYDGSAEDMTGEDSITIDVGVGENDVAFGPAAVVVDAGTEVTWEWTGNGGQHNVNTTNAPGDFTSETVEEEGHTFSQTLEETGNYLYECTPHNTIGMLGAVIVE